MMHYPQFEDAASMASRQEVQPVVLTKPVAMSEDHFHFEHLMCGCLPALAAGYITCCLLILEGITVSVNVFAFLDVERGNGLWAGLAAHNPFKNTQWALLGALGVGDIIFATLGLAGLYLCTYPNRTPRGHRSSHALFVTWSVLALVFWRFMVAFATAPWVGLVLAFEPPGYSRVGVFTLTLFYVAASLYTFYVLLMAYRQAATDAAMNQQRLDLTGDEEGEDGISGEEDNTLFCLPIEWAVSSYTVILGGAFFMCFISLCAQRRTVGGWALLTRTPTSALMLPIETVVYLLSGGLSVIGLLAIVLQGASRDVLDGSRARDGAIRYFADVDEAARNARRSTGAMLVFFLGSALRVSLFIPITGMALVERNFCGTYVKGLAATNLYHHGAVGVHCTRGDAGALFAVLLLMSLDVYMVRGSLLLWHRYRNRAFHQRLQGKGASLTYGAARPVEELAL